MLIFSLNVFFTLNIANNDYVRVLYIWCFILYMYLVYSIGVLFLFIYILVYVLSFLC